MICPTSLQTPAGRSAVLQGATPQGTLSKAPPVFRPVQTRSVSPSPASANAMQPKLPLGAPPVYRPAPSHLPLRQFGTSSIQRTASAIASHRSIGQIPQPQHSRYRPNPEALGGVLKRAGTPLQRKLPVTPLTTPARLPAHPQPQTGVVQRFAVLGGISLVPPNFPGFGAPVTPYLTDATKNQVYTNAQADPTKAQQFQPAFGPAVWKYKCIYCEADPTVITADGCWHVRESTQVDHIIPWALIAGNPGAYYPFLNPGNANHMQAGHNDLHNLHIVCANHNAKGQKGNKPDYHSSKVMSIPFLTHHKQGASGALSPVYDVFGSKTPYKY